MQLFAAANKPGAPTGRFWVSATARKFSILIVAHKKNVKFGPDPAILYDLTPREFLCVVNREQVKSYILVCDSPSMV
jgi:hypothetical protein